VDRQSAFVCSQCGATHEGHVTDYGWALPDDVWAIDEAARAEHAFWDSDFCVMGDRHFIRCLLCVPFTERAGYLGWGVWVEVAVADFVRYGELYDVDARGEPPKRGVLANAILGYEDAARESVSIQFGDGSDRPELTTDTDSGSSLAVDQRRGYDDLKYHQILAAWGAI
jgi:hypothetical protein